MSDEMAVANWRELARKKRPDFGQSKRAERLDAPVAVQHS